MSNISITNQYFLAMSLLAITFFVGSNTIQSVKLGDSKFTYDCHTNALEVSCNITNEGWSGTMCITAALKKNSTNQSQDMIFCSGLINYNETKTIHVPWIKNITKFCSEKSGFDWDNCSFTVERTNH